MANEFITTLNMFKDYIQYDAPVSYEEWLNVAHDDKAAVLFVEFYDEITLAWYKSKSFYASEEEGVETILQYLCKNVPLIIDNKSKYSSRYIYRVAYNCLYCISHDRKIDKDRYEKEVSNLCLVTGRGSEDEYSLDLFNLIQNGVDMDHMLSIQEFWAIIEEMGIPTKNLVDRLISSGRMPAKVSKSNQKIIEELRNRLVEFKDVFYA